MRKNAEPAHVTQQALASIGITDIVYIRPVLENGVPGYAVHSADGQPLAMLESREAAIGAAIQNDMEPFSVH
ncbi:MAG: DUF1150 family protein [Sphingomonadales bacterium]